MSYGLTLHTAPTAEPVSLDEAKKQVELPTAVAAHDELLNALITASRQYVERYLNRQLVTATWNLFLDRFPCGLDPILIPYAPLQSITSITYLDSTGATQTWLSSEYRVSTSREPGRVMPEYGYCYPVARCTSDAVTVRFVAGYGEPSAVPVAIKQAMLLLVSHWFENRGAVGSVGNEIAFSLNALLESYRVGDEFECYGQPLEIRP
jgi:uncharacterized phiE125 gp8 family phage protein